MPQASNAKTRSPRARTRNVEERRLGKVLDFMRLLWSLSHHLESKSKRMARRLGVTGPQRLVIRILGRYPGISAGDLADLLHLHPSTLTGVLARLEDRGLISRRVDVRDRRRSVLRLTARGKRIDAARTGTVEGFLQSALSRVSERDLAATSRVLRSIVSELERPVE